MGSFHFLPALGSLVGNGVLFAAIISAWPGLVHSYYDGQPAGGGGMATYELSAWEPYLDDPGPELLSDDKPKCPGGVRKERAAHLGYAPLPAGFDPYRGDPLFACVQVTADGWIAAAHLTRGTGSARMDRLLVDAIRTRWEFVPDLEPEPGSAWHRVRLNADVAIGRAGTVRLD